METEAIKSIDISLNKEYELAKIHTKDDEFIFYEWKNNSFRIKRIEDFNYFNIYNNKEGKKCGKDSYGNYLYFPNNIDCPINDIIINNSTNFKNNLSDYDIIDLGTTFLYYTNKNIEGNIITDIRISITGSKFLSLDLEKTNEICFNIIKKQECKSYKEFYDSSFYKIIDTYKGDLRSLFNSFTKIIPYQYFSMTASLNSISYLGFNSSALGEEINLKSFEKKMNFLNKLFWPKFILSIISFVSCIIISFFLSKKINTYGHFIISIIILLVEVIYIVINIIYLKMNYECFQLLKIINRDFNEAIFYNSLFLNISSIFILIIFVYIIIYIFYFKEDHLFKCNWTNGNKNRNQKENENKNSIQNNIQNENPNENNKTHPPSPNPHLATILSPSIPTSLEFLQTEKVKDIKCIICLEKPKTVTIAPCGHK